MANESCRHKRNEELVAIFHITFRDFASRNQPNKAGRILKSS